jgi:hypothetical protein
MQPQQAPSQPQQPPQPAAGAAQGQGPQRVANIGFNQGVQNILLSRIEKMPPQTQKILDSCLTPQTIPAFLMLLPELKPLFDAIMRSQQPGPIGQQPPQGGQPPAGGAPPSAGAPGGGGQPPVQAGGPSAAQAGGAPGQGSGDDDDESDNPLVQSPASNGLIG